ncbi:DUF6477 family protein [Palleronia pelagia]|uniref:Uncharacterized protein n=1 Tax=Palleronia pelagia TaxID=387096 RepID=A0A1H8BVX5_9RHOB|nr:DUF6477 family protein [Palleronia pelagia]SEM86017.1 hypothetical protein SAMN04488011_101716 [Palleronia pelagia]
MTDQTHLPQIRRPRLLLSAARFGLQGYDRAAALPRILGQAAPLDETNYLPELLQLEAEMEVARKDRAADYSAGRHVEVLIALLAEPAATVPAAASLS